MAIDLRTGQGKELIQELVCSPGGQGSVLLTNIGTEWLSHETLGARRPDLISCTIEGNLDGTTAGELV